MTEIVMTPDGPEEIEVVDAPIEAYGVRGMKSKPWRKTFANRVALDRWIERMDGEVELYGTRKVDC